MDLPLLDEGLVPREVVEALLAYLYRVKHLRVVEHVEIDVVEPQIRLVIDGKIVVLQSLPHLLVVFLHQVGIAVAEPHGYEQQRRRLESAEDFVNIAYLLQRQRVHDDPPARENGDEPLGLELKERVAQRRAAHAELAADVVEVEKSPRPQPAFVHLYAKIVVDLFLQRF